MTEDVKIAEMAHEINRTYCLLIGDASQPPWGEAPDWQKASAIAGVKFLRANPDAGPAAAHESWLRVKEAEGWEYGPVKDPESKRHPCMVPYSALPREQRLKDMLFHAIVRGSTLG